MSLETEKRRQDLLETATFMSLGNVFFAPQLAELVKASPTLTTRMLVTDELTYVRGVNTAQFKFAVALALGPTGLKELAEADAGNRLRQTVVLGDIDRWMSDEWHSRIDVQRAFLWRAIDVVTLTADKPATANVGASGAKLRPGAFIESAGELREEVAAAVLSNPLLVDRLIEKGDISSAQFFEAMRTAGGDGLFGELAASRKGLQTLCIAFQNAGKESDDVTNELNESETRQTKDVAGLIRTLAKRQADLVKQADAKGLSSLTRRLLPSGTRSTSDKKVRIAEGLQEAGKQMFSEQTNIVEWLSKGGDVHPAAVVGALAQAGGMSTASQLAQTETGARLLRTVGNQMREVELNGKPLKRSDSGLQPEPQSSVPEL